MCPLFMSGKVDCMYVHTGVCVSLVAPVNRTILINGIQIKDVVSYEYDTGLTLVGVENRSGTTN